MTSDARDSPSPSEPASSAAPTLLAATGKLSRTSRVRHRKEFLRIQRRGIRVHAAAFTIVALAHPTADPIADPGPDRATRRAGPMHPPPLGPRVGCAVSKRVGNAVVRARVRRLIRETFRRLAHRLPRVDFVVIAKPPAKPLAKAGLNAVAEVLVPALETAGVRALRPRRGGKGRASR